MYPESNYTSYQSGTDKPAVIKKWLIVGLPLLFVGLVLATIFWPRPSFQEYDVANTGLNTEQNFGYIKGVDLYDYNGLAFYKTNLNNNKTTVLNQGLKLPLPSNVYWATSHGALMSFSASFALSEVDKALQASGQSLLDADIGSYSWYLDFASGSLHLVSQQPIVPSLAYYSKADNGFYYVTDHSDDPHPTTPLQFYSLDSQQTTTVAEDLEVTDMSGLITCPAADRVCFIARDQSDPSTEKLFGVNQNGKRHTILESQGRLFETNNPKFYLAAPYGEDPEMTRGLGPVEHADQADLSAQPAVLHDIQTDTTRELGFEISVSDPVVHFKDEKHFYVLNGLIGETTEGVTYISGNLTEDGAQLTMYPLTKENGQQFNDEVVSAASHGSGSWLLADTAGGGPVLISGGKQKTPDLTPPKAETVKKSITACQAASGVEDGQYFEDSKMFRIFFLADDSFNDNIALFGQCMTESDVSPLHGYNFQFGGVSPVNGRIVTD